MNAGEPRVLVCDDEPQIVRALKVVLREAGFAVDATASAQEALDAAAVRPPDAAVIPVHLTAVLQHTAGDWLISHYHVSKIERAAEPVAPADRDA